MNVNLSLVSHTNVGKTTLARTLLRRDVGEVRDRAHVTEVSEAYTLIESAAGDALCLWDTPGFGDSARLLKRLRAKGNAVGWFLTEVWDRFTDRPFYSSQQAILNVRDDSDVVLYLVNASEDPASAAYVDVEMQILDWMGKPLVLLLNQVGQPRTRAADAADEARWRDHLSAYSCVRAALSMDAFARCWVQEDALLAVVEPLVPSEKRPVYGTLRDAWRARNRKVFARSMDVLARQLAAAAGDTEPVDGQRLSDKVRDWVGTAGVRGERGNGEGARAMDALAQRLDSAVRSATDELLVLHGLAGHAAEEIFQRIGSELVVEKAADVGKAGVLGGLVSGALGGLAADLAAGGLSFGAGILIGGVLGALGAGSAAKVYNVARGTETGIARWSADFLGGRVVAAMMRYLAVAHFGRGRGEWVEGEYPAHWRGLVEEVVTPYRERLWEIWELAGKGAGAPELKLWLRPVVSDALREVLIRLYPDAAAALPPPEHEEPVVSAGEVARDGLMTAADLGESVDARDAADAGSPSSPAGRVTGS